MMISSAVNNVIQDVESAAEEKVLISVLEKSIKQRNDECTVLSLPEIGILKKVAIVRSSEFTINIINPCIIKKTNKVLSLGEICFSESGSIFNCFRYNFITFENGIGKEIVTLSGESAFLTQHAIDHLNGITPRSQTIKFAPIRKDGRIHPDDRCPCVNNAKKKKYRQCCGK